MLDAMVRNPLWVTVSPSNACMRVDFPLPTLVVSILAKGIPIIVALT